MVPGKGSADRHTGVGQVRVAVDGGAVAELPSDGMLLSPSVSSKRERNHTLDLARILMAFTVVLGHTCNIFSGELTQYGASWWLTVSVHMATRWGVPLFVMISGAFLLSPDSKVTTFDFWRRRFGRILIPLLFWIVVYALLGNKLPSPRMLFSTANLEMAFHALLHAPHKPPGNILWYLYMAATLYFLAPFLRKIIAHSSAKELCVLTGALFMVSVLDPGFAQRAGYTADPYYSYCFIFFLGYFLAGQLLYRYPIKIKTWKLMAVVLAGIILAIAGYVTIPFGYDACPWLQEVGQRYFTSHLGIPTMMMAIPLFILATRISFPQRLQPLVDRVVPLTFGIYLAHTIWLRGIRWLSLQFFPVGDMPFPIYGILLIGTAACAFLVSAITTAIILKIPYLRRVV